jgi:hypothetical protein
MTDFMNSKQALIAIATLGFIHTIEAEDKLSTFKSKTYGYVVQYPKTWYLDSTLDNLEIENFPPSKAVRAVRLPPGGAAITVIPSQAVRHPETSLKLDAWIETDNHRNIVTGKRTFELEDLGRTLSLIEIRGRCCAAVPPFKEYVSWYFEIATFTRPGRLISLRN